MRCLSPLRKDSSAKPTWHKDSYPGPGHQPLAHSLPLSPQGTVRSSQNKQDCSHQSKPLSCMKRAQGAGGAQEVRGAGTRGPQASSRENAQAGKPAEVHRQSVHPTICLTAISEVLESLPFRFSTDNLWYFLFFFKAL